MYPDTFLSPQLDLAYAAKVLDELGPSGRLDTIRRFTGDHMARLYEAAKGVRPLSLAHLVPDDVEPLVGVVHRGHNSLPMFSDFAKCFCKPKDEAGILYGYNDQFWSWFSGPGYFVARPSTSEEGAIDVDYREIPKDKPSTWPALAPNRGFGPSIVFGGMIDVIRGISEHVSIGRATRRGKVTDNYFVLSRT